MRLIFGANKLERRSVALFIMSALTLSFIGFSWLKQTTPSAARSQEHEIVVSFGQPAQVNLMRSPLATPSSLQTNVSVSQTQITTDTHLSATSSNTRSVHIDPTTLKTYQGMPVGFTTEGYPFRGNPNAPVTFHEYSDFLCPFCGRYFNQTLPSLLQKYSATGQVLFVFHDFPIASLHPHAPFGHTAALCVAEQGAPRFWAIHDELFRTQDQWRDLPDPADFITNLVKGTGADMKAYDACMKAGRTASIVGQRVAEATALGFNGTPSFQFVSSKASKPYTLIGAYPVDTFTQWLDALVAGKAPPQAEETPTKPVELPLWASNKGLAPDPKHPGFTMAGSPYKGNPQAKVVVVEFSNFQCPPCQQHALEVQPAIDKAFIDNGQILWVFKNLPLHSLPQSLLAATAAECAGDQGKFWAMHDLLFKTQKQWTIDKPDPILVGLAKQARLDSTQFSVCLNSRQAVERVVNDLFDAQGVASTTPTFVVLFGGKGSLMRGSQPADQFVATLQGILNTANTALLESVQPAGK